MCLNDTSFSWLMRQHQIGTTHSQVKKHMEKELPPSFTCAYSQGLGGSLQHSAPSHNCSGPQTLQRFPDRRWAPNPFESLSLWACPVPTPTKVVSSLKSTHLGFSLFPLASGLTATQGGTVEGFCVFRSVQASWSFPEYKD